MSARKVVCDVLDWDFKCAAPDDFPERATPDNYEMFLIGLTNSWDQARRKMDKDLKCRNGISPYP